MKGILKMNNQRGAVLVVSLVMLMVLTLLGVTAMQGSTLEEKMAGNMADQSLAFQAAEAALRDAEDDIESGARFINTYTGPVTDPDAMREWAGKDSGPFSAACTNGLCFNDAASSDDVWSADKLAVLDAGGGTVYGSQSGAAALAGVAAPPRYLVDFSCRAGVIGSGNCVYVYTITARGFGGNANSRVTLEEVYRVD